MRLGKGKLWDITTAKVISKRTRKLTWRERLKLVWSGYEDGDSRG